MLCWGRLRGHWLECTQQQAKRCCMGAGAPARLLRLAETETLPGRGWLLCARTAACCIGAFQGCKEGSSLLCS